MRRFLILAALLMALLLPGCAELLTVRDLYLSDMTLLTQADDWETESLLAQCPEADPATIRRLALRLAFAMYDVDGALYGDATGAAWLKDGSGIHALTGAPGWHLTSLCPFLPESGGEAVLLFTRQQVGTTEVCVYDPESTRIDVLLTAQETLVLILRAPLYSYNPLSDFGRALLCTAEITQADEASPVLAYQLLEVAGDVTYGQGDYAATLRRLTRYAIVGDPEAGTDLADFIAAYQAQSPGSAVTADTVRERVDLLRYPEYGRLYEAPLVGIWLWRNGEIHCLAGAQTGAPFVTGLVDVMLVELTGDGVAELACIFSSGSGLCTQTAVLYDPVARQRTTLYGTVYASAADSLSLEAQGSNVCCLVQGRTADAPGVTLGRVTRYGLDGDGYSLDDFASLISGESTYANTFDICPGTVTIVTGDGLCRSIPLSDGTMLTLRLLGPEMVLSDMEHTWRGLRLIGESETFAGSLAEPVDGAALLTLLESGAEPEDFVEAGLLTCARQAAEADATVYLACARTEDALHLLRFADGEAVEHAQLPLNHDRMSLEQIGPGMTLEEVRSLSPGEGQYPFLYRSFSGTPSVSIHCLPTGEALIVTYTYTDAGCIVTETAWLTL